MPKLEFTNRFDSAYSRLTDHLKKKTAKALKLLAANPRHPSLQTKQIQGRPGIYEARVDRSTRMTYERTPNDTLLMRTVGPHDETLRNP